MIRKNRRRPSSRRSSFCRWGSRLAAVGVEARVERDVRLAGDAGQDHRRHHVQLLPQCPGPRIGWRRRHVVGGDDGLAGHVQGGGGGGHLAPGHQRRVPEAGHRADGVVHVRHVGGEEVERGQVVDGHGRARERHERLMGTGRGDRAERLPRVGQVVVPAEPPGLHALTGERARPAVRHGHEVALLAHHVLAGALHDGHVAHVVPAVGQPRERTVRRPLAVEVERRRQQVAGGGRDVGPGRGDVGDGQGGAGVAVVARRRRDGHGHDRVEDVVAARELDEHQDRGAEGQRRAEGLLRGRHRRDGVEPARGGAGRDHGADALEEGAAAEPVAGGGGRSVGRGGHRRAGSFSSPGTRGRGTRGSRPRRREPATTCPRARTP